MASRSNSVYYALLELILSLIFIRISISNCFEDSFDRPLVAQTKTSTLLEPRYDAPSVFSHLRECRKRILWEMALLKRLAKHRSTLLLRFGDVEKNPGPPTTTNTGDKNKKNKFLTVIHVNTRSLLRHFDDVSSLVSSERPHILALSETWLDSSVVDGEVHIPGYTLFRFDRNRSGGGVAIYCADNLPCSVLSCSRSSSGVESLWISVRLGCLHPSLAVGCFYRPPGAPSCSVNDVCDNIENMMLTKKYIVACGDFNINLLDLSKSLSKTFQQFITSHSLIQPITVPTRYNHSSASLLDLFLATPDVPISKSTVLDNPFSDHLPVLLRLNTTTPATQPALITHRTFKNFSEASFAADLSCVPWSVIDIFDDPDDKVEIFNLMFTNVLDDHAPVKTTTVKKNPSPWITRNIKKEMDRRNRLFRFYRRNPSSASWNIFKAQRNRVVWLQRKAKFDYFHRLVDRNSHPSVFWNTLKRTTSSSSTDNWSSFNSDFTSIANTLNTHFESVSCTNAPPPNIVHATQSASTSTSSLSLSPTTPEWCERTLAGLKPRCASGLDGIPSSTLIAGRSVICYPLSSIINSSIASSHFPFSWKCASIKPLHKSGDRATPSNYRPISLLPVPSKIIEKHVRHQLTNHLENNNLMFPFQSGFRSSHSTQTLLLYCLDKWYKAIDAKKFVGVVFLDISKAFDTVDHNLLLSKLADLDLSPSTISWFQSYLSNRCHVTRVSDSFSYPGFPSAGVPQGSVLGPSLFSAFINDLPSVLPPGSTVLFADDTTIYIVSDSISTLQSSLQLCLDLSNLWLQKNGLTLNISKTKSMLIHSSRRKTEDGLQLSISGNVVEQVRCFKFLGVYINDTLTWYDHIDKLCSKVTRSLHLLRRLSWFLPKNLLLLFLKSYILPSFDYCDIVWSGCTKQQSLCLESLLTIGCRIVLHRNRNSSASAVRKELGLPTLASRRKLHLAQMMFKCLSSRSPTYLSDLFPLSTSHHFTRASSSKLNLPSFRTSMGQKSFSFLGASLWRTLPPEIRANKDFNVFSSQCEALFQY